MSYHADVLTIHVDSREKRPLVFPAHLPVLSGSPSTNPSTRTIPVHTNVVTMETGDYASPGSPVTVERKGSVEEVWMNVMSGDRLRFLRALDRLAECPRPVLLMEGTPSDLISVTPHCRAPHLAVDGLLAALMERAISLLVLPTQTQTQRRAAGELVARLFWSSRKLPASTEGRIPVDFGTRPDEETGRDPANEGHPHPEPAPPLAAGGHHRTDLRAREA